MTPIIETIDWLHLTSGDHLCLQVYKFVGDQPGPKAYLQANLHGAEIVGNAVIYELIEHFSTLNSSEINGEVWLVPVCNPLGSNQRSHFFSTGRFNPYDGKDWNRIFWDYEKECDDLDEFAESQLNLPAKTIRTNYLKKIMAAWEKQGELVKSPQGVSLAHYYRYQLQSLCLDANYVIDIHSSSNQGIEYLYCFGSREDSAGYFNLDYGIVMTDYDGDAFDEAFMKPWLALEKSLTKLDHAVKFEIESWTLELGAGMAMQQKSVKKGVSGIKNYLLAKEILISKKPAKSYKTNFFEKSSLKKYHAPVGGVIQERVKLGDKVKTGEVIYQILSFNKTGELPKMIDIYAQEDGFIFDVSTNQAVNQGEYVLEIVTK